MILQTISKFIKPDIEKRNLLVVMAAVWSIGGIILFYRGVTTIFYSDNLIGLKLFIGIFFGVIFYYFMFSKIVIKHTTRLVNIENEKPCLFSFINLRSYFLMVLMISTGVFLRKSEVIPLEYLSGFYIVMGTPLLISAFRFFYFRINYNQTCRLYIK